MPNKLDVNYLVKWRVKWRSVCGELSGCAAKSKRNEHDKWRDHCKKMILVVKGLRVGFPPCLNRKLDG